MANLNKITPLAKRNKAIGVTSALFTLLAFSQSALGHIQPEQSGTVKVIENSAFAALSLNIEAFSDIDDDGDNQLSLTEYVKNKTAIKHQAQAGISLTSAVAEVASESVKLMYVPNHDDMRQSDYVSVLIRVKFLSKPQHLKLQNDLWAQRETEELKVKANFAGQLHYQTLTEQQREVEFFAQEQSPVKSSLRPGNYTRVNLW